MTYIDNRVTVFTTSVFVLFLDTLQTVTAVRCGIIVDMYTPTPPAAPPVG